jgi:hypothetical protein
MDFINSLLFRSTWLFLLIGTALQGQTTPSPAQGTVDPSGKFTPAKTQFASAAKIYQSRHEAESALMKALDITPVNEHVFKIGAVTFDKVARSIAIPATVNMRSGIVEYALVGMPGKRHEALFTTEARPEHVHLATLFLGMKQEEVRMASNKPFQVPEKSRVLVEVTWEKHGPAARYPLEALFSEQETTTRESNQRKPMNWWYNGSILVPGGFVAQQEHSIIALMSDLGALINDTHAVGKSNDRFYPITRLLPKEGTAAKIILTFQ